MKVHSRSVTFGGTMSAPTATTTAVAASAPAPADTPSANASRAQHLKSIRETWAAANAQIADVRARRAP